MFRLKTLSTTDHKVYGWLAGNEVWASYTHVMRVRRSGDATGFIPLLGRFESDTRYHALPHALVAQLDRAFPPKGKVARSNRARRAISVNIFMTPGFDFCHA